MVNIDSFSIKQGPLLGTSARDPASALCVKTRNAGIAKRLPVSFAVSAQNKKQVVYLTILVCVELGKIESETVDSVKHVHRQNSVAALWLVVSGFRVPAGQHRIIYAAIDQQIPPGLPEIVTC